MVGGCSEMVQAGMLTSPEAPVTEQLNATLPVKPPLGVTVMGTWITPPRHPITKEFPLSENEGVLVPIVYAALATALVALLVAATALMVIEEATAIGPE